jgi:hypothetical protein
MNNQGIKTEIITVTPELAAEWLKTKNTGNRPVTRSHVRFLASQMERGEWNFTGEAIQFSESGRLIDGQHRLHAIVDSKTSQSLLVVSGVPDSSQSVIDTGKTRSAGDVLSMNNVTNHTITAAMIKNFMRYKADITSYGGDKKYYHTNHTVLDMYNSKKELFARVALYSQKLYKASTGLMPASVIGGFYLLFLEKSTYGNEAPVTKFFDALLLGKNREYDTTSTILYKKLLHAKVNRIRLSQRELYGLMVKTWNSEIEGKYVQHLNMKPDEEMPKILEHPESGRQNDLFKNTNTGVKQLEENGK